MTKKITHIKAFLKATKPEGLKLLMLRNNFDTSCYHDYVITHDGASWFAWYEVDAENLYTDEIKRLTDEEYRTR